MGSWCLPLQHRDECIASHASPGIGLVEIGDDDLLHLHHGLHDAIGLLAIGIAEVAAERRGHDLPGQAEFVLEPSAMRRLAAIGGQLAPEVVHLFLGLDADEEGYRLVELELGAAIERVELCPSSSKVAVLAVSTLTSRVPI